MEIAFVHPNLGIGGAERLVVDAAIGLQDHGFNVTVFTSHYNKQHSFPETEKLEISVHGNLLPNSIGQSLHVFFALLKNLWLALCLLIYHKHYKIYFVDQVSICVPILKLTGSKIIFYCHFPDKLLANRNTWLLKLYRTPFDWIEKSTTLMADNILVNSEFTKIVFCDTFKSKIPIVLYPGINFKQFENNIESDYSKKLKSLVGAEYFISINRFEFKKRIDNALYAFKELNTSAKLVLCGGYDPDNKHNHDTMESLIQLCKDLQLTCAVFPTIENVNVVFVPSIPQEAKSIMLKNAIALVYTPPNEHFGIVPVEAMHCRVPVIAMNSGGPKEIIDHLVTGYLCDTSSDITHGMRWAQQLGQDRKEIGQNAHQAAQKFSQNVMVEKLIKILK